NKVMFNEFNNLKKHISFIRNIILGGIVLYLQLACSETKPTATQAALPQVLPVVNITSTSALTTTEYPASIQGIVNVDIRPQVSGSLDKVFVDEGSFVKKGQSLFKIDEQPFRAQLNSAIATLRAAEAATLNTQLEVDKLTPLVQNKVVSEYQLKAAQASHKIALANVQQAQSMVKTAQINLGYTLIKAPVSGYIGRLPKKQGNLVSPSDIEALTQLSDVRQVYVYFSLGESDFMHFTAKNKGLSLNEKIKNLPPVSLILSDNSEYAEKGKIDMVDGQFDKNTGAITLRATFSNAKGLLRSGNTGRINLGIIHPNAILVPQQATVEVQDKVFVFAVDKDNTVSKRPIVISGKSNNDYIVQEGVNEGDRIVFKGFENLQDGATITPEPAKKELAKN
ncbi:efflux RND transporter periplasmic adaptor subunit, partial [Flectobacillus major]|uniref:efflux RND transporter periplasmic adaptor subunit n=1 Tax=Flectobacillus major TaxID=103 RepID=UPI00047AFE0B